MVHQVVAPSTIVVAALIVVVVVVVNAAPVVVAAAAAIVVGHRPAPPLRLYPSIHGSTSLGSSGYGSSVLGFSCCCHSAPIRSSSRTSSGCSTRASFG